MINEKVISESDVAKFLGITLRTLRNRRYAKKDHPPYVKFGQRIVFPEKDLMAWVHGKIQKDTKETK